MQARAESDRLNLIIDSVADPIVVTDAGGATSLMNEPAERLFTIPARASAIEQRWVQANDAHFSSFIAGMLVSADQRRVGEIGLIDPKTGRGDAGRGDRRQDSVRARRVDGRRDDPPRPPRSD